MVFSRMRIANIAAALSTTLVFLSGGCASHKPAVEAPPAAVVDVENLGEASTAAETTHAGQGIEDGEELNDDQRAIRVEWVQKWISFYTHGEKSRFQRHLDRAEPYRWVVEKIFEEQGVPAELFYLGVIESGFQNHARSRAAAVGIWQFIPGTASRYNLTVNRYLDERRDPIRATAAAARYLKDLYNVFHSWPLAMAAYNAGEGRVLHAVMRGNTRNFWELCDKGMLPTETANYVPKILAAMLISKNRARYGMREAPEYTYPALKLVEVPPAVSLFALAQSSGVPVSELKTYNPQLVRDMTPPVNKRQSIWVTEDSLASVQTAAQSVKGHAVQFVSYRPSTDDAEQADTAEQPARTTRQRVRAIQRTIASSKHTPGKHTQMIFVKRGETLFAIAQRFGMNPSELKRMNALKSSQLVVGQSLKVPGPSFKPKRLVQQYRVRPGDNLHQIARKFGKSVSELRAMNALKRETVYAGEILKIEQNGI